VPQRHPSRLENRGDSPFEEEEEEDATSVAKTANNGNFVVVRERERQYI
jgi:hypothetical protein